MNSDRPLADELVTHAGFLRALARGLLADEHAADDVVQQAFLRALARPPESRGFLRAWLGRVVRHLALNRVRDDERRHARERAAARPELERSSARAAVELTLQREVAAALAELGEPYRTVVHLRYFRGLSLAAIARELDLTPKVAETRLAHAQAALRRRLMRAWNAQDERARALMLAALPSAKFLAGVLMTKQLVLVGVGGALLVGLVLTWRALDGAGARAEAPVVAETPLEPPRVPLESSVEVEREPVASQPESEVEEPAAQVVSDRDTELRVALEELGRIADRSLEGRFDPGAMLATALLVAAHEVGAPDPEPDFAGRVQLPIEGLPEGFEAGLYVTKPNSSQQRVLSLEIRLPRETPLAHGNYERAGPKVTLTTWTSEEGEFKHINIGTDFETERRVGALMQDPPDMLLGFSLRTSLADPSAWKLTASGLREIEGTREADGSHRQKSAQWEVPQVLEGRPWPQLEEMTRLNQRLHELLASAKARSAR